MKFDPAARLKSFVDDIQRRGHCSPYEVIDLLRRVRLLLEKGRLKKTYPVLSLYCDWVCHPELDRNPNGFRLLRDIDKVIVDNHKENSDELILSVSHSMSLEAVRESLIKLFSLHQIEIGLFKHTDTWREVARAIIEELLDRPVSYPADVRTNPKAPGSSMFLQAVAYRELHGVRSDITTTSASFVGKENEDGESTSAWWCVESQWENSDLGVKMMGPLLIAKPIAA